MISSCVDPSCNLGNKTPCKMPDPQHDIFATETRHWNQKEGGGHTPHRGQRRCAMITTAAYSCRDVPGLTHKIWVLVLSAKHLCAGIYLHTRVSHSYGRYFKTSNASGKSENSSQHGVSGEKRHCSALRWHFDTCHVRAQLSIFPATHTTSQSFNIQS